MKKKAKNLPKPPKYLMIQHPDVAEVYSFKITSGVFSEIVYCYGTVAMNEENDKLPTDKDLSLNVTYRIISGEVLESKRSKFGDVVTSILYDIIEKDERKANNG